MGVLSRRCGDGPCRNGRLRCRVEPARLLHASRAWLDSQQPTRTRPWQTPTTAAPSPPALRFDDSLVTTAFELPGHRVVRNLGVVRGITVRSRSIVGNFLGGIQTIFGGNITIYTELCEQAREETYRDMVKHARQLGANAIIGMRYDATDVMTGLTEVLCYGTAVVVEPLR
jgi:uncharacterized protein YbjQ (UPF0145 family)